MKQRFFKIAVSLIIVGSLFLVTGCSRENKEKKAQIIKIGVVGEQLDQWTPIINNLAKEDITVQLVKFGDYIIPNQALADGDIDLNAFQHYAFINNQIRDKGYQICAIGDTFIAPLGLYSTKIKSLSELKNGDKIAIPNDPTNGGRSLKVLEA